MTSTHVTLARVWLFVVTLNGCGYYGEPTPPPPVPSCSAEGVDIPAEPGSGACYFAQRRIMGAVRELKQLHGFDASLLVGYVVEVGDVEGPAVGLTFCDRKVIRLETLNWGLPHEVAHAMENCARDEAAKTEEGKQHPDWLNRGVYAAISAAG